eukprot:COSAG04_NODE_173_length_21572_cov_104.574256_19_plen_129_part_00
MIPRRRRLSIIGGCWGQGGATTGDSHACGGFLVDPTAVAAGEYYSRIVSYFNEGSFVDEYGKRHVFGGKRLKITNWEVLNGACLLPDLPCCCRLLPLLLLLLFWFLLLLLLCLLLLPCSWFPCPCACF